MRTVRAVTLNLWGEQPPLERRMALIAEQLAALSPDVVALQEVRQIPGWLPNQAETLAKRLGFECHFAIATPLGERGDEGLALLSRFPVVDRHFAALPHQTSDERRIALGITVQTPVGRLAAFTTHLTYRPADGQKREDQVVAAEALVASVASDLPKLWMGDFNAVADSDEIRYLRGLHSIANRRVFYQDAWMQRHGQAPGYTWAAANPQAQRLRWLLLDRRIDYLFVTPLRNDGRGQVLDCRVVLDTPDGNGVFASDHFGLFGEIQLVADSPSV